ncbi:MAG: hypothetical protein ACOYOK_01755 [Pseudobdellovibrionaceae bacterium]
MLYRRDERHRRLLLSIKESYLALIKTISTEELNANRTLRKRLAHLRRQINLIEELNSSFERIKNV